jgi:hypothetical protein
MNINEKINSAKAYMDTLTQQVRSLEAESAGIAQRLKVILFSLARVEGGIIALEELKADLDKEVI